jgi:hypothetical protein
MNRLFIFTLAAIFPCSGQLLPWGSPVPRRAYPPVLFVTGHDAVCPDPRSGELPFFNLTFGKFDEVMVRSGRVSLVFEACYAPNRPPMEEIAHVLGRLLDGLVYEDGQPVEELDVVAHSMGGLIVRTFLSGKQSQPGVFRPPPSPKIRNLVFIGTPHFGTAVASPTENDPQLRQMSPGSLFLFELATWNQGGDDFRGANAMSVVGTAGVNGEPGFTDSVVTLTSGALDFSITGRTLVTPYCHTFGGIGALLLCPGAIGMARVDGDQHPTARAVLSFLNGGVDWHTYGVDSAQYPTLTNTTGLLVQLRTGTDEPTAIRSAALRTAAGNEVPLNISIAGLAHSEKVPSGPVALILNGMAHQVYLRSGGAQALVVKPGPLIKAVEAAGPRSTLSLISGRPVRVTGVGFGPNPRLRVNGTAVSVSAASATELIATLPQGISGLHDLTLQTDEGRHTTRIYVDPGATSHLAPRR